jgi:hypothetical protein
MDTYFPTTILLWLEGFRQHFPAQHFAYFRGYVWALAMLGPTRQCMTNIARSCVFVDRHLASWERFLAESHWDLRGVSQTLVARLLQQLGSRLYLWDALLAAVDTTLVPKGRGQMPGVQKWHDHSGDPARGESLVGHHWALIGLVSAWGVGYLCWPVLARLLPGQLNPLGFVAGCGSRKLIATRNQQVVTRIITRLAAHSGDVTHPLLGLPGSAQPPGVGPAAALDNPSPAPGACANDGNTGSTRPGAA